MMQDMGKPSKERRISILVPCYNEEAVVREFYRRTSEVIDKIDGYEFKFVFVNDGSRDITEKMW